MNTTTLRTLSVSGVAAALLIAASPVCAHQGHHYLHAPRFAHGYRPAVVVMPPSLIRHVYAPAPAYSVQSPAYPRATAYYGPPRAVHAPLGAIGGALAGAAIGSSLGHGDAAATAIGSVIGAVIADQLTRGR